MCIFKLHFSILKYNRINEYMYAYLLCLHTYISLLHIKSVVLEAFPRYPSLYVIGQTPVYHFTKAHTLDFSVKSLI